MEAEMFLSPHYPARWVTQAEFRVTRPMERNHGIFRLAAYAVIMPYCEQFLSMDCCGQVPLAMSIDTPQAHTSRASMFHHDLRRTAPNVQGKDEHRIEAISFPISD